MNHNETETGSMNFSCFKTVYLCIRAFCPFCQNPWPPVSFPFQVTVTLMAFSDVGNVTLTGVLCSSLRLCFHFQVINHRFSFFCLRLKLSQMFSAGLPKAIQKLRSAEKEADLV